MWQLVSHNAGLLESHRDGRVPSLMDWEQLNMCIGLDVQKETVASVAGAARWGAHGMKCASRVRSRTHPLPCSACHKGGSQMAASCGSAMKMDLPVTSFSDN